MAGETILVRLKAIGQQRFKRDMDSAAESVDGVGAATKRTTAATKDGTEATGSYTDAQGRLRDAQGRYLPMGEKTEQSYTRQAKAARKLGRANANLTGGLRVLAIVAGVAAASQGIGLLVSALGPALVGVVALTAAVGGLAAALGVMGFAAVIHFKESSDVAGSVANRLKEQAGLLKGAFAESTARGATAVLAGLIPVLRGVRGLVRDMEPAFTTLGQSIGKAFRWFGDGIRELAPELSQMLTSTQGAWQPLMEVLLRFISLFARLARDAMPYVIDGLEWLAVKMGEWNAAVENGAAIRAFETLGDIASRIGDVLAVIVPFVGAILAGLGQIADGSLPGIAEGVESLTEAFRAVVDSGALETLGKAFGDTFGWVAGAIKDIVQHLESVGALEPMVLAVAAAFVAWKVAIIGANIAMAMNPAIALGIALTAIGLAAVYAYNRFETFRNIVDGVWRWIKDHFLLLPMIISGPLLLLPSLVIDNLGTILDFVKSLPGRIASAAKGMWEGLKSGLRTVLKWAIDAINLAIDGINQLNPFGDIDHVAQPGMSDNAPGNSSGRQSPSPQIPGAPDVGEVGAGTILTAAFGGPVPGGAPYLDRVPSLLTPGEHVWTRGEVQAAGGHRAVEELRRNAGQGPAAIPVPAASSSTVTVQAPVQVRIGEGVLAEAMANIHLKVQAGIPT